MEFENDISVHILKLLYEHYLVEENGHFKLENKDTSSLSNFDKILLEKLVSISKKNMNI